MKDIVGESRIGIASTAFPPFRLSKKEYRCHPECPYLTYKPSCVCSRKILRKFFAKYGEFRIDKKNKGQGCPVYTEYVESLPQDERRLLVPERCVICDTACPEQWKERWNGVYLCGNCSDCGYRLKKVRVGEQNEIRAVCTRQ